MGEDEARSAVGVAVLALLGVSTPVFALVVSIVAFAIATYALLRVNRVVKQLEESTLNQASEISELAADPSLGGSTGDG